MRNTLLKLLIAALSLTLLAAACGSDSDDDAAEADNMDEEMSEDTAMAEDMDEDMEMSDDDMDMDEMDMEDMNMGDPDATPAYEVEGADLVTGTFELLDTRPEGYDDVIGEGYIARHDGGTTVTMEVGGLLPEVEFIAHVHEGDCSEGGGDHYKFDPEGSDVPPNEIHLAFVSSADGQGFMTAENHMVAGEDARSLVVHPLELLDNKIACAPL